MTDNPNAAHDPYEPFVNERAAARFLNVSVRTLQRWRTEPPAFGAPRFYRLGKRVAYRLSVLSAGAERHAFTSTAEADAATARRPKVA